MARRRRRGPGSAAGTSVRGRAATAEGADVTDPGINMDGQDGQDGGRHAERSLCADDRVGGQRVTAKGADVTA